MIEDVYIRISYSHHPSSHNRNLWVNQTHQQKAISNLTPRWSAQLSKLALYIYNMEKLALSALSPSFSKMRVCVLWVHPSEVMSVTKKSWFCLVRPGRTFIPGRLTKWRGHFGGRRFILEKRRREGMAGKFVRLTACNGGWPKVCWRLTVASYCFIILLMSLDVPR